MMVDPCEKAREAVGEATRKLITTSEMTPDTDFRDHQDSRVAYELYLRALAELDECENEQRRKSEAPTRPLKPPK